jgi:hypothetical protein
MANLQMFYVRAFCHTTDIIKRQSSSFQTPVNRPKHGTDTLATKKSGSNALWFLLVGIYQRQSFCSSTSCKCKRSKARHHNSCCECWQGHAPVRLERIALSYCTMLGLLDRFWSPIVPCYSTEDAVRNVNSFYFNHTSLQSLTIIYYTVMRLHNYNPYMFATTITYSTLARLHSLRALHSNLYCTIARKVS